MVMKNNLEEFRGTLVDLCNKALEGNVTLDEFRAIWPSEIPKTNFVSELYDDLEEGITHFPSHLFSGKKDFELWSGFYEAYKLSVDAQLLASGLCEERMFSLRKNILDKDINDKEHIGKLINEQQGLKGSG